ncbi:hypothetical protein GcM3_078026 [Golovinomyces cichoracearum]|uniref:DUF7728 domain-containing protein n=1 Tax=Golovinomyces cichoracearum TaxID=62708 RepID=A0A420IPV2_9PEZI|nr:hypothetical protein GcM3_078026 [Golovinomyces cichoracearum]
MLLSRSIVPVFAVGLAQALLVPKYASNVVNNIIGSSDRHDVSEKQWLVQVEYPTELVAKSNSHFDKSESILELNFTIQHKDIDHLMLNDIVIYPANVALQTIEAESLTAPHLIKSHKNKWEYVSAAKLGYMVNVDNLGKPKEDVEQITVQIDIFEETATPFHATQTIQLQLSKPYEKLIIKAPPTSISRTQKYSGSIDNKKCNQILCTVKSGITKALTKAKGALKSCHKMIKSHLFKDHKISSSQFRLHEQEPQLNLKFSNPRFHSENSLHYHLRPKNIAFLRKTILPNIIPTLMGIVAGISAAIIGVLLGHLAVYIWSSLRCRNSNRYISIEQSDSTDPERDGSNYHQINSPSEDLIASTNEKTN